MTSDGVSHVASNVQLRQLPYPYRAMLAICSDLDETPDRQAYWEIMRFLNTNETTAMGPGVGLEVGNSIYFDMPPEQFAYWNTDDYGRRMVQTLIRSGHIDCLHSYGDLATTRAHARRALDELARYDCRLEVWIDHAAAATNFDPLIMYGHGDEVRHEAYHADLTMGYGIRYVWRGRVTSIIGQDVPARLGGIFNWSHPVASGRTLFKEIAKQRLARSGNKKYAMHGLNEILRPIMLRDGSPAYEFMRCNPHWGGVTSCEEGRHIGDVLTSDMLDRLVERGGICVLYTHLGKTDDPRIPFNQTAVRAFRRLAEDFHGGRILVTTTRRLLGYCLAIHAVSYDSHWNGQKLCIAINTQNSKTSVGSVPSDDLRGLTFYVPDSTATCVTINGREVANLQCNDPDHTGRPSVSLAWPLLAYPQV